MMKVKMFRNSYTYIERDINEFFENLGRQPGYRISLHDIKMIETSPPDTIIACVIYNQVLDRAFQPLKGGNVVTKP